MKNFLILLFAAFPVSKAIGQINLEEIRALSRDTSSRYFYDTLVVDFLREPEDFEMTKGITIYYGKLFSKYYKPYDFSEDEVNFDDFLRRGNYARAITLG